MAITAITSITSIIEGAGSWLEPPVCLQQSHFLAVGVVCEPPSTRMQCRLRPHRSFLHRCHYFLRFTQKARNILVFVVQTSPRLRSLFEQASFSGFWNSFVFDRVVGHWCVHRVHLVAVCLGSRMG